MKKTIFHAIILLLVVPAIALYFFLKFTSIKQDLIQLKKENAEYKQALEQNKILIKSLQTQKQEELRKSVSEIREKQTVETNNSKKGTGVYISAIEMRYSPSLKTIAFWVNGPDEALFDAMDLGLTFTNMKKEPECVTGDVFSQYPLIKSNDNSLLITGVAGISTEKIAGGTINKKFVSCTFEKEDVTQKANIEIDPTKTHIYSLGKSVLSLENSFKNISW